MSFRKFHWIASSLSDVDDEKKLECNNGLVEWLERTSDSPDEKVRISREGTDAAAFFLAGKTDAGSYEYTKVSV